MKYISTLLPQTNDPTEIQKGNLDLLSKINQTNNDLTSSLSLTNDVAVSANDQLHAMIGVISMWPASDPPENYLICDGSAVGRIQYATLFGILGTMWGAGDGATTFNLPDMRAAAPKGVGTSVVFTTNETVVLGQIINDQIMDHGHIVTDPGHSHRRRMDSFGAAGTSRTIDDQNSPFAFNSTYLEASVTGITLGDTSAQRTTPAIRKGTTTITKSIGLNFIIKYA